MKLSEGKTLNLKLEKVIIALIGIFSFSNSFGQTFPIVGTGVTSCFNNTSVIQCSTSTSEPFYGQFQGKNTPEYKNNDDGTISDLVTGLMWISSPDAAGDNDVTIEKSDKLTWAQIQTRIQDLNSKKFAGYRDWRIPTIKELYSLTNWTGTDPSGLQGNITTNLIPFIDSKYFPFAWGFVNDGERLIDVQYASSNLYNEKGFDGSGMLFGFNFADGRIKGYGLKMMGGIDKTFSFIAVRGNQEYGINSFVDNNDNTISDKSTCLMWAKEDSKTGMNWEQALAWAQSKNSENYCGYKDWRLPNTKELQSIVDYSRTPGSTNSAAINPVFNCTSITNEAGNTDWPWFWTSTTHQSYNGVSYGGSWAIYVCFGRASGWMQLPGNNYYSYVDVHGAGAQRSSPKSGTFLGEKLGTDINGKAVYGLGPQGDILRINNFVRLVRDDITSSENHPPSKPDKPQGNINGLINTTYQFTSKSVDIDGDSLSYFVDWGDGKSSNWSAYYPSNIQRNFKHSWSDQGTFSIKIKSKDTKNLESEWSETLQVIITINPQNNDSTDFRYETLGRPTSSSVTINVLSSKPIDTFYEYGSDTLNFSIKTDTKSCQKDIPVVFEIGNLMPNSKFFYRINFRNVGEINYTKGQVHSFTTQRKVGETFTFDIEADPHLDSNSVPEAYSLTLANILNDKPDFLIDLGDNFMCEKLSDKSQKNIIDRHLLLLSFYQQTCHSVPLYLVLGNHEGEWGSLTDNNAKVLSILTSNTRKLYFSNPEPNNFYSGNTKSENQVGLRQNYYSWEWGSALFVVLDPYWYTNPKTGWGMTLGLDQYKWLENTLKSSKSKFKFVFCHNLVGGADKDMRGGVEAADFYEWGGKDTNNVWSFEKNRPGWSKPIHQLMVENGVNIFFHGHDHFYGYQEKDGVIYQEVPQPSNRNLTNLSAGSYGYKSGVLLPGRGYLRITVADSLTKVEYVKTLLQNEQKEQNKNGDIAHSYIVRPKVNSTRDFNKIENQVVTIFPNPANDVITFKTILKDCAEATIEIMDANSGKILIRLEKIQVINDNFEYILSTLKFLNGNYLCKITTKNSVQFGKFIIQK